MDVLNNCEPASYANNNKSVVHDFICILFDSEYFVCVFVDLKKNVRFNVFDISNDLVWMVELCTI